MADLVPLPKGSYAIAHVQKRSYALHTGIYLRERFYVIRVVSASREGKVKTFVDNAITSAPSRVDRSTTIYSLPDKYLAAAEKLFAKQPLDFTGYTDKEHLRLALVNVEAKEVA